MTNKNPRDTRDGELVWTGDLTVQRVTELKEELRDVLSGAARRIAIRFDTVEEVDVALFQLLCSGHRSASRIGKQFEIVGDLPDCFTRIVHLAGFSRHAGCDLDGLKNCIWKAEFERAAAND